MQIEKEHKKSSLMRRNKSELVEHIMCLEHNNNVLHDTINQQFKNFKAMTRWVPVRERLPEEGINPITGDYYVYPVTFVSSNGLTDIRYYSFGKGHWWYGGVCMDRYVTAWVPLPEPYREDSNCELPRQTNAERLRAMTDDELAAELCYRGVADTVEEVKQWLQEPSND